MTEKAKKIFKDVIKNGEYQDSLEGLGKNDCLELLTCFSQYFKNLDKVVLSAMKISEEIDKHLQNISEEDKEK